MTQPWLEARNSKTLPLAMNLLTARPMGGFMQLGFATQGGGAL
jgi:hypothetical protein